MTPRSLTLTKSVSSELVHEVFTERFGTAPLLVHSPGRINLLGEHTDYNNGFVMPAAIDKGVRFAIAKSAGPKAEIYSVKYKASIEVDPANPSKVASPLWANYLLGVMERLTQKGLVSEPFNCVFDGNLPTGAGLSSSAALECGFVFALNEVFKFGLSRHEMIHIAQWAEHHYVGVMCGIMDQFASMMGKVDHAMILDCQSLEHAYFPLELDQCELLLVDTGVKHSLASSAYNTRRQECEEGVRLLRQVYPEIKTLRDVSHENVLANKRLLPEVIFNRCAYVTAENERVLAAGENLKKNQLVEFGRKMYQTHEELSNLYEVSCAELDFLVEYARENQVMGSRMMGGGFGGCTLNIIDKSTTDNFIQQLIPAYYAKFGIHVKTYRVKLDQGTSLIATKVIL